MKYMVWCPDKLHKTDGRRFQYIAKVWLLIKKKLILVLNNYLMPPYAFPELHTGNGKTYH